MTNKRLAVGAVVVLLMAIAVNTALVVVLINSSSSHHADTSGKISQLERDLRKLEGGYNK